jgi:hypothetical protein
MHRKRFIFNNQPDALIIQMQFHPDSAWKRSSETRMILTSAGRKLLMMGREDARNM